MATDYISRKKAIEEVCGDCEYYDSNDCEECRFDRLMKIPAADVRPVVKGSWNPYPFMDDMRIKHYSCSVCKRVVFIPHGRDVKKEMPYCHCGADMRGLPE